MVVALALPVAIGTGVVVYRSLNDDPDDLPTAVVERTLIPPFGSVRFRVGDDPTLYCALLASDDFARQQGMQRREDLGGYDAMVFAWSNDATSQFSNHFVPVDLQIGWYDKDGLFVDGTTMDACPDGDDCPAYGSTRSVSLRDRDARRRARSHRRVRLGRVGQSRRLVHVVP